jgi:inhibitor of cysteine peptidase
MKSFSLNLVGCALFFIIFYLTIFCSTGRIVLSKSDQGKTVVVSHNSAFTVNLKSNPSTGFAWEILDIDSSIIRFNGKTFQAQDSLPGSAGVEHLVFNPVKKGKSLLKLGYLRDWEGRNSITDSLSVLIKVR